MVHHSVRQCLIGVRTAKIHIIKVVNRNDEEESFQLRPKEICKTIESEMKSIWTPENGQSSLIWSL